MASSSTRRKAATLNTFCMKKEQSAKYRQVAAVLQKAEADRTDEEKELLINNVVLVEQASERQKKRQEVKARSEEVEDPDEVLVPKCKELATALRASKHLVIYTGAGISTAAKIPDYRGTNGIWTLLQKGKDIGCHDLSQAEPTLTHMALFQLYTKGILKYVVSQNCDGLHLRSGLPRSAISEVHGNMHIEVCRECRPCVQYWRLFDVTENTGRFSHRTMRRCHVCHNALLDTIVHFGERGSHPWPLNWPSASKAADKADVILCIGSSLKVLKKYPWLWGMDKPAKKRPKLYIINLQWTPKDDHAVLKINGRCDRIMQEVMKHLDISIPTYDRLRDPIFIHATWLHPGEEHTTSQPELDSPVKRELPEFQDLGPPAKKIKVEDTSLQRSGSSQDLVIKKENSVNSQVNEKKATEGKTTDLDFKDDRLSPGSKCSVGAPDSSTEASNGVKIKKEENNEPSMETDEQYDRCVTDGNRVRKSCDGESSKPVINNCESGPAMKCEDESVCSTNKSATDFLPTIGNTGNKVVENTSVVDNDMRKIDSPGNKTHRLAERARKDSSSENIATSSSEGKENREISTNEQVSDLSSKTSVKSGTRDKTNAKNCSSSVEKENCSDEVLKKDETPVSKEEENDSPNKNTKSNVPQNGTVSNLLKNMDLGVLRNLQVEHNYSKASSIISLVSSIGHSESAEANAAPTRTSSRVRERRTMALAAAETASKVEPPPVKQPSKTPQTKDKDKISKADYEIQAIKCSFCQENYMSSMCLFYPSFNSRPRKFEGCICECCDYSDSEEEAEAEEEEEESKEGRSSDNGEEQPSKAQVINPGWYGKGYRKRNFRRKK